ncbi:uncharacterized protein AMSG_09853 [Thecamonas trahens ATCC 50062]|uniref:Uncharacterized protein n=1 Tax=Thecamonas trahens ATCC 50062 TaxID=461836 RepID=A0A0L0DR31_THETB|nr:hypothetical protein AMSG_09853 [Thecamonas trahens ATCC 50062]KNC53893.1 hypothetical protein AMSG_09853 [Thecamonas trahens ATCC 50062]|eukprot:XP_013754269.1 hypothetical protein AMSG_09853 [Thecamonas trahens ATCC 50062]
MSGIDTGGFDTDDTLLPSEADFVYSAQLPADQPLQTEYMYEAQMAREPPATLPLGTEFKLQSMGRASSGSSPRATLAPYHSSDSDSDSGFNSPPTDDDSWSADGAGGSSGDGADVAPGDVDLSYRALGGQLDVVTGRATDAIEATRLFGAFLGQYGALEEAYARGMAELTDRAAAAVQRLKGETLLGNSSLLVAWDGLLGVMSKKASATAAFTAQLESSCKAVAKLVDTLRTKHAAIVSELHSHRKEAKLLAKDVAAAEKAYTAALSKAKAAELAAGPDAAPVAASNPKLATKVKRAEDKYESAVRWSQGYAHVYASEHLPNVLAKFEAADVHRTSALQSVLVSLVAVLKATPDETYHEETSRLACRVAVIDPIADVETFVVRTLSARARRARRDAERSNSSTPA